MGTVKVAVFICGLDFETFFLGVLDFFQNGWKMEKAFEKVLKRFISFFKKKYWKDNVKRKKVLKTFLFCENEF